MLVAGDHQIDELSNSCSWWRNFLAHVMFFGKLKLNCRCSPSTSLGGFIWSVSKISLTQQTQSDESVKGQTFSDWMNDNDLRI